jgi:hypothetical protein
MRNFDSVAASWDANPVRVNLAHDVVRAIRETIPLRPEMDVLDALTGNTSARSVVELSLAPDFRRTYSSVYAAIGECFTITKAAQRREREQTLLRLIAMRLARPPRHKFWLFGIDATSVPRVFAPTLPDRGFVHCANPIGGNKPITLGHQYSLLAYLPDKLPGGEPAWIVPLIWRRISTQESELAVAVAQVATLLTDERLPFHNALCVQVDDSRYSTSAFLHPVAQHANLVTIARLRGTRTLYRPAAPVAADDRQAGHPRWYGAPFALHKPSTWGPPVQTVTTTRTSRRGRTYTVQIQAWHDLLMRGTRACARHTQPFTLVRVRLLDAAGQPACKRDLWLVVLGTRRLELTLLEIQQAYAQRFDLEHFFRFSKQQTTAAADQLSSATSGWSCSAPAVWSSPYWKSSRLMPSVSTWNISSGSANNGCC